MSQQQALFGGLFHGQRQPVLSPFLKGGGMKKVLLATTVALLAGSAWSAKNPRDELCESVSVAAEAIMTRRQNGVSMVEQMKMTEDMQASVRGLTRQLIADAYSTPRYSTQSLQQRSIEDFRDSSAAACYK